MRRPFHSRIVTALRGPMAILIVLAGLPLLQGCASLIRSQVSQPEIDGVQGRRRPLLPSDSRSRRYRRLWGAQGGVEMERDGVRLTLHVVNRKDKFITLGPWLLELVPMPILPLFWGPAESFVEGEISPRGTACDSVVTVLLEIRTKDPRDPRELAFDPSVLKLVRADGRQLSLRSSGVVLAPGAPLTNAADTPRAFTGPRWFQVLLEGNIPIKEHFTVETPEILAGGQPVRFPAVRYSGSAGWFLLLESAN